MLKAVLRIRIRSFWVTRIQESTGSGSWKIPDPDPGKYRILYPQKDPCNSNFLVIKLSKIQFRTNNFLSLILGVIGCLDLLRKYQEKNIYFANHQKLSKY